MRGKGKGDFTRNRSEIEEKIGLGWPIKMVWQHCKDAELVDLDYSTFRKYVNSIIGYRPYKGGSGSTPIPTPITATPTVSPPAPPAERTVPAEAETTKPRKGTEPNFAETPKPTPRAEPDKERRDGPIMVGTFNQDKPIRPGNKGMALSDEDLY